MSAKQRLQLQRVEAQATALMAELDPRVILPAADKQAELGIAEETLLIPVGPRRAITMSAKEDGGWAIKEFDTSTGNLVPIWEDAKDLNDEKAITSALGAALVSLKAQLAFTGADALPDDQAVVMNAQLSFLEPRHAQLTKRGLDSFEFETGS